MDPTAVQQACMADLGRQRQEELPLSNKERKGASYLPNQRNGTGHYAPDLKRGLEDKWNVQIQDEETVQMQGLAVEDTRPWAKKIASGYMERHALKVAPPLVRQEPQGRKRSKKFQKSISLATKAGSLGDQVVPGRNAREMTVSRSMLTSVPGIPLNDSRTGRVMPYVTVACGNRPMQNMSLNTNLVPQSPGERPLNHNSRTENAPGSQIRTSVTVRTSKVQEAEHLIYKGICKLLNPEDDGVLFIVSFSFKIQRDSDRAVLSMSKADKTEKDYDVLDLAPPTMKSDCCHIQSKASDGSSHLLQFSSPAEAGKFCLYLVSLQQAAAHSKPGKFNTTKEPAPRVIVASQGIFDGSASKSFYTELKPNTLTTALDSYTVQPIQSSQPTNQLVDVNSPPQTSVVEDSKIAKIEDAAEKLFDVIKGILPEVLPAGLHLSEAAIHDIEDTAIDNWLTRGFLISETDDMKSELLDLLRILVRIKRKAKSRKHLFQPTPTIQSLKDYDSIDDRKAKPNRIKYTSAEIESLARARIPTPTNLNKSLMSPYQKPKIPYSAADSVVSLAKHKGWLTGVPALHGEGSPVGSPAQTNNQQVDISRQNTTAQQIVRGDGAPSPKSPSTSAGLGTSR